jgi:Flp pilus assembly protein TadB
MITASEGAVTITIWILTVAGAFFGTRAARRRRKQKRMKKQEQWSG